MIRCFPLLLALAVTGAAHAQTVYKCAGGGRVTYADRPCEQGPSRTLPPPVGVDPNVDAVQGGDSRTLLETDKLRAKLRVAEQERHAREREDRRAERQQARVARAEAVRRKRCDKARLHVKWAQEDAARATIHKQEAARARLRRRQEAMAVECRA